MLHIFIYEWRICWYGLFRKQREDLFQVRDFRHQNVLAPSNDQMTLTELLLK